ncbi:dCMP deaminase family protein [Candidatus Pacearchaeota archaeon]|nr:dCMP deaminase family protein [Candidatus Pacearchaeota archaeon]
MTENTHPRPSSIEFSWVGPTVLYPGQRQAPWEYCLNLAQMAATRSQCLSRRVGAVLVRDGRIIATGYNGTPSGMRECQTCQRKESGKELMDCHAIHAEENALLQCALYGPSAIGAELYCTLQPCYHCAKLIIQAKIKEVSYIDSYPDKRGLELLEEAKIPISQFDRQSTRIGYLDLRKKYDDVGDDW